MNVKGKQIENYCSINLINLILSKDLKIKIYKSNITSCVIWLGNMVSSVKGGKQAKGI